MKNVLESNLLSIKSKLNKPAKRVAYTCSKDNSTLIRSSIHEVFPEVQNAVETIDDTFGGEYKILIEDWLIDNTIETEIENLRKVVEEHLDDSDDIKKIFQHELEAFEFKADVSETGVITEVKDGVVLISGLSDCLNQELLFIGHEKIPALALNLEKAHIGAIVMGNAKTISENDIVRRSNRVMEVGVDELQLGRVIDPLGNVLDNRERIIYTKFRPIEHVAPGVMDRQPVTRPLQTGIKAIDSLIPIGKGQRELILGDRQTGKTAIAIDTILNQKDSDVICVYVAIGQKASKVAETVEKLRQKGGMENTVVVVAGASDPAALLYLAPYTGVSIAEYFALQGKDVLIVYDDLTKHAVAYREMSLLLRRPPGREAYPGDVFYIHSRLLERACSMSEELGGGTITALPIIETQAGDISAYIPTNVISITDGQIFLESDLFYKGVRPAINVGLSVSRVGSAAQAKPMAKVSKSIKLSLAQFRELEAFAQFSSDLDSATKQQIERGKRLVEVLKQPQFQPLSLAEQVISIYTVTQGFIDDIELGRLSEVIETVLREIKENDNSIIDSLGNNQWDDSLEASIKTFITEVIKSESKRNE